MPVSLRNRTQTSNNQKVRANSKTNPADIKTKTNHSNKSTDRKIETSKSV